MTTRKSTLKRVTAGIGALALATLGVTVLGTAASADGYEPPDGPGELTIHKHVDEESDPGDPQGDPLNGVKFEVQEIGKLVDEVCTAFDLGSPADWVLINAALTLDVTALPAQYCDLGPAVVGTTGANGQTDPLTGLNGLYVVTETDPGENLIVSPAAPFILTVPLPDGEGGWIYDVHVYPKNTLTTFEPGKTVADENVDLEVVPGALIPWTISAPVPTASFPYYEIIITDTPAPGHEFVEFTSVSLNGTALDEDDHYTVSGSTITLTPTGLALVNGIAVGPDAVEATIVVTLVTEVTGDVLGELDNSATIVLNGNTRTTPEPLTIWGKLVVNKHLAGNEQELLDGAQFEVYELGTAASCDVAIADGDAVASGTADGGTWEQVLWIANANADVPGPFSKAYCLLETVAPDGHILDSTPVAFTLTSALPEYTHTVMFPNVPVDVPELPLTGANGTLLLTLGGIALVGISGGGYLVHRSRQNV